MAIGIYQPIIEAALRETAQAGIIERIWAHDYTVWKPAPTEITNRLGWMEILKPMREQIPNLLSITQSLQDDGFTHALLLGMGGSSLAPEVFRKSFGVGDGYLDLAVLDSTDPAAVLQFGESLNLEKTVFIVSTKSGGTVETFSFFKYFYNQVRDAVGPERAGGHFIAITDPGSKLGEIAQQLDFRSTLLNDPNIGGRYSALSYFGLLPASLVGIDLELLLERAVMAADSFRGTGSINRPNKAEYLGVLLGELAKTGRDKLTLILPEEIASFGDWIEQLIAESTGKEGIGILPVVGESVQHPAYYGKDRVFVHLRMAGDSTSEIALDDLKGVGQPVVTFELNDVYDLGEQIFMWELATAVAGSRLGINPFDQPNVEAAKVLARQMVSAYHEQGELPKSTPALELDGISVYGDAPGNSPGGMLAAFLSLGQAGSYVSLQAYIHANPEMDNLLGTLRSLISSSTNLAATIGYGPRYLHSTGQLHKGDGGKGLFIQFTANHSRDLNIPDQAGSADSAISFGVLEDAQALGDAQALQTAGRKVIRFHFTDSAESGITSLINYLAS